MLSRKNIVVAVTARGYQSTVAQMAERATVVYFDQLLGAVRTQKLVETFFSAVFQPFLLISKLFQ